MDQLQSLHYPFQRIQPVSVDSSMNPTWLTKISIMLILFNNVTKINIQREKKKPHQMCQPAHECANGLPHKLNL